jgi:endonuclease-8
VPEGDSLHRAARRLQPLVGERLAVETPHPRAAVKRLAERLDGRRLEGVEAVGKNLFLRFEGGVVLRSHLRLTGRWFVQPVGRAVHGRPWLVLRGERLEAVQRNGPVLELTHDVRRRLGPDILESPPDIDRMVSGLRGEDRSTRLAEALQLQRVVSGIGNMWAAEALWVARLSPWLPLGEADDDDVRRALEAAHELMRASLEGGRSRRQVYRRSGLPCRRCGGRIRSRGQGDDNRTAYWCPGCQRGPEPPRVPQKGDARAAA